MLKGHINLPSKQIQYLHKFMTTNSLKLVELNIQKCQHILKYIKWINVNHKYDRQWFFIVKNIIRTYKLSIVYYLREGFERLTTARNADVLKQFKRQVVQILELIRNMVQQVNPKCTMRNFCLKFLQIQKFKIDQKDIQTASTRSQHVILTGQEILLYKIVYTFKTVVWNIKRYLKQQSRVSNTNFQFQRIQKQYNEFLLQHMHFLNIFERKTLMENYQNYLDLKAQFQAYKRQKQDKKESQKDGLLQNTRKEKYSQENTMQKSNNILLSSDGCIDLTDGCINKSDNQLFQKQQGKKPIQHSLQKINYNPNITKNRINQKNFYSSQPLSHSIQTSANMNSFQFQHSKQIESMEQCLKEQKLCCRQYFIKDEMVGPQTKDIEYKNYAYPWNLSRQTTIGNTICSFLNSSGGNIFIGIQEDNQFNRKVIGYRYSNKNMQDLNKTIRQIAQTIKPDIITQSLYEVNFIPVKAKAIDNKNRAKLTVLKDTYIVKISVHQGIYPIIYNIYNRMTSAQQVYFRTNNQVLSYKSVNQILLAQRQRMMKQYRIQRLFPHENCGSKSRSTKKYRNRQKSEQKEIRLNQKGRKKLKTDIKQKDQRIFADQKTAKTYSQTKRPINQPQLAKYLNKQNESQVEGHLTLLNNSLNNSYKGIYQPNSVKDSSLPKQKSSKLQQNCKSKGIFIITEQKSCDTSKIQQQKSARKQNKRSSKKMKSDKSQNQRKSQKNQNQSKKKQLPRVPSWLQVI